MTLNSLIPWRRRRGNIQLRRNADDWFNSFYREMNELMDRFFRGWDIEPFAGFETVSSDFVPRVDVSEDDKEIRVTAELPGMDERDVEVVLSKDALTISGEKKEQSEDKGRNYYRMERRYGSFHRVVPLTAEVDENKVEASFKNGVLTVRLPKTAEAQSGRKKIEVKSA